MVGKLKHHHVCEYYIKTSPLARLKATEEKLERRMDWLNNKKWQIVDEEDEIEQILYDLYNEIRKRQGEKPIQKTDKKWNWKEDLKWFKESLFKCTFGDTDKEKCPRCQCERVSYITTRDQYQCLRCNYRFSLTSKTIFHNTHLPLETIAKAYEDVKDGCSAMELKRKYKLSYETAWHLKRRLKKFFAIEFGEDIENIKNNYW